MELLSILSREEELFERDLVTFDSELKGCVSSSRFLVLGGAGTIG